MNIFALDYTPAVAAECHCDKHVVKMVLETTQLLCTCHRFFGNNDDALYKATHVSHPCSIWVRQSSENYMWTSDLLFWLLQEYYYRFDKEHACSKLFDKIEGPPDKIPIDDFTYFAEAMPEEYRGGDPVEDYRYYYAYEKSRLLYYTRRTPPDWLINLTPASYRESPEEEFELLQEIQEKDPLGPGDPFADEDASSEKPSELGGFDDVFGSFS